MRNKSESFDPSSKAVMRFGALRENPPMIEPLLLPSVESYANKGSSLASARGFDVMERETQLSEEFNRGVEVGRREALEENQLKIAMKVAELDSVLGAFSAASNKLETAIKDLRIAEEHDLATFAVSIVEEIVGSAIYEKRDFLIESVKKAIVASSEAKKVSLRLNPKDISTVKDLVDSGDLELRPEISLTPDKNVELSAVVMEADAMRLDLQFSTALERLRQSLDTFRDIR